MKFTIEIETTRLEKQIRKELQVTLGNSTNFRLLKVYRAVKVGRQRAKRRDVKCYERLGIE